MQRHRYILTKTLQYRQCVTDRGIIEYEPVFVRSEIDLDMIHTIHESQAPVPLTICFNKNNELLYTVKVSFGEMALMLKEYRDVKSWVYKSLMEN